MTDTGEKKIKKYLSCLLFCRAILLSFNNAGIVEKFFNLNTDRQGTVFSLILDTINRLSEVNSVKNRIQSRSNTIPYLSFAFMNMHNNNFVHNIFIILNA